MTVYVTGCTHFGHKGIVPLAKRPFDSVEEMNETMIERWNQTVRPVDTVYHLGDFAWSEHRHWASRLNGRINLIWGNHDDKRQLGFWADDARDYRVIHQDKHKFVLFHYPIDDWDGRWRGSIHLHCHTHSPILRHPSIPRVQDSALEFSEKQGELPRNFPPDLKCNKFCVGVDSTDFRPINIQQIIEESRRD